MQDKFDVKIQQIQVKRRRNELTNSTPEKIDNQFDKSKDGEIIFEEAERTTWVN